MSIAAQRQPPRFRGSMPDKAGPIHAAIFVLGEAVCHGLVEAAEHHARAMHHSMPGHVVASVPAVIALVILRIFRMME